MTRVASLPRHNDAGYKLLVLLRMWLDTLEDGELLKAGQKLLGDDHELVVKLQRELVDVRNSH